MTDQLKGAESFLTLHCVLIYSGESSHSLEPEVSLPYSQKPANFPTLARWRQSTPCNSTSLCSGLLLSYYDRLGLFFPSDFLNKTLQSFLNYSQSLVAIYHHVTNCVAEVLRVSFKWTISVLLHTIIKIGRAKSEEWKESIIVPIHKKGG